MRRTGSLLVLATTVATTLSLTVPPSAAESVQAERGGREGGAGLDRSSVAATQRAQPTVAPAPRSSAVTQGYPRQSVLPVPAVNQQDAALKLGMLAYHDLAPRLNALQTQSNRVSVEVIGQSTQGRDLYLLTVTAPESRVEARRQQLLRDRISNDPAAAANDRNLARRYKAPYMVNANIHGNEWEGTDGLLQLVEELALSKDRAVAQMLRRTRVHAILSVNPDGRVNNTRANAAGFDMNRDFITASQPETVATRDTLIGVQPLVFLDLHGYVAGTLLEPATAPHAQNAEYDLYIKHALPNALGMEDALQKAVAEGRLSADALTATGNAVIPFRDYAPGDWDDWPPIFTPMYAMLHGAIGHTIEIPLRVNNLNYTSLSVEELQRRARINKAVAYESAKAGLAFTDSRRAQLIADQIETFRRGAAGEPRRELPIGFVEGAGPEDQGYTTEFPRAYVIPVRRDQRSEVAAARLVDHLVANDVRVTRADEAFTLGGRRYARGSYVVDMHQPKRAIANVMLEAGRDISERVPQMYDISGWSHRLLWGASVDIVSSGELDVTGTQVTVAEPTGSVPRRGDLALELIDPKDVAAVNALLAQGVSLGIEADGTVVVPAASRAAVTAVADRFGVTFTAARPGATRPLRRTVVAAAASADDLKALRDMGFEVRPVSTAILDAGTSALEGADVLYVSAGLVYDELGAAAKAALQAYFRTGGVVTGGAAGADFNAQAGLLSVTSVQGRGDANGVVRVDNTGGPVTDDALPHSFVYGPRWFTDLGPGVVAEQRFARSDVLVAGHWRPLEGPTSVAGAAGQASIVRGQDETGASVVLFGTEPTFRDHPKGLFSQVGRAVFFTGVDAAVAPAVR